MNKIECLPENIRLKSNFLGPKSENGDWLELNINNIFSHWCQWRRGRFPTDGNSISPSDLENPEYKKFQNYITELHKILSIRFEREVPKYSPRYMGHMVSEMSLPALFGHLIALLHNPNNSSFSSSKVGLTIEQEAISMLGEMVGFEGQTFGHFTSGGTIANIEGLWRARYRMDCALSLGAYLTKNQKEKFSIFDAAHMSFDRYEKIVKKNNVNLQEVQGFSFVLQGAFEIQPLYSEIFDQQFLGPILLVPAHKHYSWQKAISLLGMGEKSLWPIQLDTQGHLCLQDLEAKIEKAKFLARPILAVVSVAGTTELGMVDPVDKVQDLLDSYKENEGIEIWHHVDGAYGGIYASFLRGEQKLVSEIRPDVKLAMAALSRVDSITLDPHKLAMVPYACGALLVRTAKDYKTSEFDAPYLREGKEDTSKWPFTLEGSRSATGACATWMVAQSLGMNRAGMGKVLSLGLDAKRKLESLLVKASNKIKLIPNTDLNIICFSIAADGEKISIANENTDRIYQEISQEDEFSVSQTTLHTNTYGSFLKSYVNEWNGEMDCEQLKLIRMVIMNPFLISKENPKDYMQDFVCYLTSKIDSL